MALKVPEWFQITDSAAQQVMQRIAEAVAANNMSLQVTQSPIGALVHT
ncbi:hypothetical protein [Ralstonia mannitolilytica]|nr:hypothetical protein [Ralstonia mannitolilytica]